MKKLLSVLFFMFIAAATFAQKYVYEDVSPGDKSNTEKHSHIDINKIRLGAYFAPAINWMHPTASKSNDGHYSVSSNGSRLGYSWGLVAEYYFADNYCLVSGFNINLAGGKLSASPTQKVDTTQPDIALTSSLNYKLQYLEIPFAIKLRSDELPKSGMHIFGQVGLTAAINISKKATYTIYYTDQSATRQSVSGTNETLQGSLSAAPVIIQLNIGAGLEYPITEKMYFFSGLFFNNGFLPTAVDPQNFKLGYNGSFSYPNIRLNSFTLRIGLFF
jgi:hypothetical protein